MRIPSIPFVPAIIASVLVTLAVPAMAQSTAPDAEPTLFQQLGGQPAISAVLKDSIELWFKNPVLADSFRTTNRERLHLLLVQQFTVATGGGGTYTGRDMVSVHKGLNITTAQFNALAEDLQTVLDKYDVPYRQQNRILALLAPLKRDVVTN